MSPLRQEGIGTWRRLPPGLLLRLPIPECRDKGGSPCSPISAGTPRCAPVSTCASAATGVCFTPVALLQAAHSQGDGIKASSASGSSQSPFAPGVSLPAAPRHPAPGFASRGPIRLPLGPALTYAPAGGRGGCRFLGGLLASAGQCHPLCAPPRPPHVLDRCPLPGGLGTLACRFCGTAPARARARGTFTLT